MDYAINMKVSPCRIRYRNYDQEDKLGKQVWTHTQKRNQLRNFTCIGCAAKFDKFDDFDYHVRYGHPDGKLRCLFCGKLFTLKALLNLHIKSHEKWSGFPEL